MLQIIKAHPNWHVHADVFEHPMPNSVYKVVLYIIYSGNC